jgi:hypothetical protein
MITTIFEARIKEEAPEKQVRTLNRARQGRNRAKHQVHNIRDGPA